MVKTEEERMQSNRISRWKRRGIIVKDNKWDTFYNLFLSTTDCEICKKALTTDKKNTHSTRMVDHDHNINDRENVRSICCHACNSNDKSNNTSGEPNIDYEQRSETWRFQKQIQGKRCRKSGFKTIEEAIDYKKQFLDSLKN